MEYNVLLINPPQTIDENDAVGPNPFLGLSYIAAVLERERINVNILDTLAEGIHNKQKLHNGRIRVGLSEKEIIERLKIFSPMIVGISCAYTAHDKDVKDIARLIKNFNEKIIVVVGGAHASSNPNFVLEDNNIDIVVKGEGELTFLELVKKIKERVDYKNIIGIIYKSDGKIIFNNDREYVKDLDTLPFPARHMLPMHIYNNYYRYNIHYNMRSNFTTMITSRGCPGNCVYCAVKTVWGRKWRGRSAKNIVDEIEFLNKTYGIGEIAFLDDSISVNKSRLMDICEELIKRKVDIKWSTPNGIAIWLLDKKLIRTMKKAGCYRLTFGLESGNKRTLNEFIGKNYDYEKAKELIKYAHRNGLWTIGTFIIGFPNEQLNSIKDTIDFAINTHLDFAVFYTATPFPGTRLYEIYNELGLKVNSDVSQFIGGCNTLYFTADELNNLRNRAYSKFLITRMLQPWHVLTKARSFEDICYILKLSKNYCILILNLFLGKMRSTASLRSR